MHGDDAVLLAREEVPVAVKGPESAFADRWLGRRVDGQFCHHGAYIFRLLKLGKDRRLNVVFDDLLGCEQQGLNDLVANEVEARDEVGVVAIVTNQVRVRAGSRLLMADDVIVVGIQMFFCD